MSDFQREILFDVLLRLEPKDLIRCMCVSKAWNALIRDKHFIKCHLQRSIETNSTRTILLKPCRDETLFALPFYDNDTFGTGVRIELPLKRQFPGKDAIVLGYSNGLVCIRYYNIRTTESDFAFWNPSIQKLKKIPSPTTERQPVSGLAMRRSLPHYAFGYDPDKDDYKLVSFVRMENSVHQVSVYSLKCNSWKRIEIMPRNGFEIGAEDMVFLKGALFWLVRNEIDASDQYTILSLDLADEKYRCFSTPVNGGHNSMLNLDVLGGCLCIGAYHSEFLKDFWIMKEYGVTQSWTLLYSIQLTALISVVDGCETSVYGAEDCLPLVSSKNGETVLLWVQNCEYRDRFYWYDLEKKSVEEICGLNMPYRCNATICWGSLCLLEGDPVIVEEQHQVPSASKKRTISRKDRSVDAIRIVKAIKQAGCFGRNSN